MQQRLRKPPFLAFLTAVIFAIALAMSGWIISVDGSVCLLGAVFLTLFIVWPWIGLGQDTVKRATLVLCISSALIAGKITWIVLPGNWFALLALAGSAAILCYLLLRRFLDSVIDLLWALSLPNRIRTWETETWRTLLYTRVSLTSNSIWRIVIEKLRVDGSAEAAQMLANAVTDHPDPYARQLALAVVDGLNENDAIGAVCKVWAATRHADLAALLIRKQWRATAPSEMFVLSTLLLGQIDDLRTGKVEWIQPLAQAIQDSDPCIAERASEVLRGLENVKARDALCHLVSEQENPPAQAIALSAGYLPQDEQERALFLFMTEQWERYASHDFDRRLMHSAYLAAPEPLRQRIREKLRILGRIDFLPIIAGDSSAERTSQFNASESEVLVQTLIANRDWAALWRRVFDLPFQWSVRAVSTLSQNNWKPTDDEEQALFAELAVLITDDLPTELTDIQNLFPFAIMQATAHVPGRINAVSFAPERPILAIGTGQGKVVLWNYQTAKRERVLRNFQHSVGEVAFTSDGTLLCAERTNGSATCSIYVFADPCDSDTSYCLGTHTGSITALTPVNNSYTISAGSDQKTIVWDLTTRKEVSRREVTDWARNLCVSPDGTQVLFLRRGLDLLSFPDLKYVASAGKGGVFRCAAFAPDSQSMFIGTYAGQLLVYRKNPKRSNLLTADKKPLTVYASSERVEAVEVSKRLSLLVSAGTGGEIRFFSLDGHDQIGSITVPGGQITSLNISPNESFLAVGSAGATLTFWDLRTLDIRLLLERPFAQAEVIILPTLDAMLNHTELSAPARRVLQFARIILRHRLRYTIEIEEAPSIAFGEFDIEVD